MIKIEDYISQRPPFLFVDRLLAVRPRAILGLGRYEENFLYRLEIEPGRLIMPGVLLVEALMQCGGAGADYLAQGRLPLLGLARLKAVRWPAIVELPASVVMRIQTERASSRCLQQRGTAYCRGAIVAEAAWRCLPLR